MKKNLLYFIQAFLNSYAILFFSQSSVLGALLVIVSFFNLQAGLFGALAVCLSLFIVNIMGFARDNIQAGLYSFNSLLLGIGLGTFYHYNSAFLLWLATGCVLVVIVSVVFTAWLGKYGLPVLSLPFVLSFWILLAAVNGYTDMGLLPKESYMLSELSATGHNSGNLLFIQFNQLPIPHLLNLFFRALSAVLFQDNLIAGVVIGIGLFVHSRISFCLLIVGFIVAFFLNQFTGIYPDGISHYHLGVNFMMIAVAIGGFFLIPSWQSYIWAVIGVPIAFLLVGAFTRLLAVYSLPVLSLPFCIITITLLCFFKVRLNPGKLKLTPVQYYSPETNLYQYVNNHERLQELQYLKLSLPFLGNWTVSQGYDGGITHKARWGQALDFIILDEGGQTHLPGAIQPGQYYSFGKPVLACADGVVEAVINHIPDNPIGKVNTEQNWGNSVVIKHTTGMYSQVSHLKQFSVKVSVGDFVKQGDLLALCGNSGRSPEPHLHFQVQQTPNLGSPTIAYPFAYYLERTAGKPPRLNRFNIPEQGSSVGALDINTILQQAFAFRPGYTAKVVTTDGLSFNLEVHTDSLNHTYLYCTEDDTMAYFVNNHNSFYFTNYYGTTTSILYSFYLAAYRVVFNTDDYIKVTDSYPLKIDGYNFNVWVQDIVAPFYQFMKRTYQSYCSYAQNQLIIHSSEHKLVGKHARQLMHADIYIGDKGLTGFTVNRNGKITKAQWHSENIY